jgi:ferredoxin
MSDVKRFKIEIDRSLCCGYGVCKEICPTVYDVDEGGLVVLKSEIVSGNDIEAAQEGADACPQSVIVLTEVE